LEEAEKAGGKEANKKNVVQKVCPANMAGGETDGRRYLTNWWRWLILVRSLINLPRGK